MSTASRSFALNILVVIALKGKYMFDTNVCPNEMVELYCPPLEQAIKSGDYGELIWKVADPRDKSEREIGLTLIANQAFNLSGTLGKMVSIGNFQDMWWYWIKRDGKMQKIAYCNSESCVFDECNSTCQSRLRIDGATLELTEVREEDRGLQLQCQIFPKFQVYKMKISVVLPKDSFRSTSSTHGKNEKVPSNNTETTSETSRKSKAGTYGTQNSASSRTLLAFLSILITSFGV
ncbi:unnamed protein product [Porites evermanni]|uniref:Uncharacterized protein n=1 Tax=Porites evermanni TaxID=104178 RepID=A0ABN8SDP7_9CNID|nr:unnamed protein product [Porites evermanni]